MDHLNERILHLTLEIISLLTGESFPAVKSCDHVIVRMSPRSSLLMERSHKQKILGLTNTIVELLRGETGNWSPCDIPGRQNIKEEEPSMAQKEAAAKDQPSLTPPEGSGEGNPSVRSPPHSSDASQEDQVIASHDQEVIAIKVEVVDEEESYGWAHQRGAVKEKEAISGGPITAVRSRITRRSRIKMPISQGNNAGLHSTDELHAFGYPEESSESSNCKAEPKQSENMKQETVESPETGKGHSCPHCGRRFNKKANLLRHCLLHTGEKPLTCPDCGKSFARKSNLIDHQRTHTGEKPFPCSECNKSFTQKSNLIRHQRTHRDERIIICSQCGKYFTHEAYVVHLSIHRGEEPFHCYECGQCFTQKSDLLAHQRYHAGEHTSLS